MNKKRFSLVIAIVFGVGLLLVMAATVPFSAFNTTQFSTNGNVVSISSGAIVTNATNIGTFTISTNPANISSGLNLDAVGSANMFWNQGHPGGGEFQVTSLGSLSLNVGYNALHNAVLQIGSSASDFQGYAELINFQYDSAPQDASHILGYSHLVQWINRYYNGVGSAFSSSVGVRSEALDTNGNSALRFYNPTTGANILWGQSPGVLQLSVLPDGISYSGKMLHQLSAPALVNSTNLPINYTNARFIQPADIATSFLNLYETNLAITNQVIERDILLRAVGPVTLSTPTNWNWGYPTNTVTGAITNYAYVAPTNIPAGTQVRIHVIVWAGSTTNTTATIAEVAAFTPTYDTNAQAFFTASGITNLTQKGAINTFVLSLKANNLWSRWDCIYPFVGGTSNTCSWNLANTNNYRIAWSASGLTFDSTGVLGNGSTGWGNTQFRPSTASSPQWSANSAAMVAYIGTSGLTTGSFVSSFASGTARSALRANASGQVAIDGPNSTSAIPLNVSPDTGTMIGTRTSSTQLNIYMSGTSSGGTAASVGVPNNQFGVLCRYDDSTPDQFCAGKLKILMLGASVASGEVSTLTTIVNQLQTDLGR